jgi:hypothetical protein
MKITDIITEAANACSTGSHCYLNEKGWKETQDRRLD